MNKFDVEIVVKSIDESIMGFTFETERTLEEAQEFYGKHWPSLIDVITSIHDWWVSHKKALDRWLNFLTAVFLWKTAKDNCKTKFIVSKAKEDSEDRKDDIETLIEKLWGKAIKLDNIDDLKEVLKTLEKLIK